MLMRGVSVLVIVTFLTSTLSCTSNINVLPGERIDSREKIIAVVIPTGQEIAFDKGGGVFDIAGERILGRTVAGEEVSIALADILYLRVERFDTAKSVLATVAILALAGATVLAIALAAKESCPFIYAFDGTRYVLDVEPLGGAVCHGLRRTDYCRLDHLAPDDGPYRLLIRNEVEEIQYLDELALLVFDHSPDVRIVADVAGNFHAVSSTTPPVYATDEAGRDLRPFFVASDGVAWQSHMPRNALQKPTHPRHELTLSFPKPADAPSAKLIVNAGASLWGSNMIRELLALRGPTIADWYDAMDEDTPQRAALHAFLQREELYSLRIMVAKGDEWVEKSIIRSGGPLVIEDQVIELDLADVDGDSLTLRLRPPFGFWSIDHFAVTYDVEDAALPVPFEIPVLAGLDERLGNVTSRLSADDEVYYVMQRVGDRAEVTFQAPAQEEGTQRTVFLRSSGYYEIQLPEGLPDRRDRLLAIIGAAGGCVDFAIEKYLEWITALRAEWVGHVDE